MPLPPGTATLKIHPAIGFARQSINNDTYVFGNPQHPQGTYKSNGLIKRQSVQFRLFAYDANNVGLAELTPQWLTANNLRAVWHARVANRKTARLRQDDSYVIAASARSDQNHGRLVGRCGDFVDGQAIELGEISGDGLFTPPLSRIARKSAGMAIPATGIRDRNFTDNVCDGTISVQLIDQAGTVLTMPTYDAWIVVAPPDFAPDWDDVGDNNLYTYLSELLSLSGQAPANPVNQQARRLDRSQLERGTSGFSPGIEISVPQEEMFYAQNAIGAGEVRVRPGASIGGPGTLPGELTAGLCSPWQFDFRACTCSWWPNHRPDVAFKDAANGPEVDWIRRREADTGPVTGPANELTTNEDFVEHVDKLGIIRRTGNSRVEMERDQDI
jgi:hypothetical protein